VARVINKILPIGVSVGLGTAAAAVALALGGASGAPQPTATGTRSLKSSRPLTPVQNRRPLSSETRAQLSDWATRLTGCLTDHGLAVGPQRAGDDEVVIRVSAELASDPTALVTRMGSCTKALGGPPPASSVVLKHGAEAIQIYKPKTCLIPKRVAE
jgi:hypothetical protein